MARKVLVEHPTFGRTLVQPTRVRHLSEGWTVVDEADTAETHEAPELEPEPALDADDESASDHSED